MIVKQEWTDRDFELMGWHDSCIHSISFPIDQNKFVLDIDYIFEWEQKAEGDLYRFWVSPCELTFYWISNLKISLDFGITVGLDIMDITRSDPRTSPNGTAQIWKYVIDTDMGAISFEAAGFCQMVKKQPVISDFQVLPR